MTILASDALLNGWPSTILIPNDFQLNSGVNCHLMAGDTKLGSSQWRELKNTCMDAHAAIGRVGPNLIFAGVGQDFVQFSGWVCAGHRVKDGAGNNPPFPVYFGIFFINTMT